MAPSANNQPVFDFKIETAEVKKRGQGVLFYILPPLVVASVFVYCHLNSQTPESSEPAAAKQVKTEPVYSTTAQYIEDDEELEDENADDE